MKDWLDLPTWLWNPNHLEEKRMKDMNDTLEVNLLPEACYSKNALKKIDGVVIHYISAVNVDKENKYDMDTIRQLFIELNMPEERTKLLKNDKSGRKYYGSAHYLVGREGEIHQLVPLEKQAWHAGKSEHRGRPSCNSWTVGIEVVGEYGQPFTEEQYIAIANIIVFLKNQPNVTLHMSRDLYGSDLTGHEHVAVPIGRKKDPGPTFDWKRLWDIIGIA